MKRFSSVPVAVLAAPACCPWRFRRRQKKKDPDAIGDRDVGKGVNFYSLEKEIALGKQLAQEVERQAKIVDDPIIAEYVNRVGQNLVRNSDAKVPFTIKVLDSEEVNAFALPGGFFFVNSGLILKADTEVRTGRRDGARDRARGGAPRHAPGHPRRADQIAIIAADRHALRLDRIRHSPGRRSGYPDGLPAVSRGMERKPITSACNTCTRPATIPTSFVDFFEKIQTMEKKKPGTVAKVFSTHPMTDDRIKASQKEIQKILVAKPEYVVNTSEFNDVKARLHAAQSPEGGKGQARSEPSDVAARPGSGTGSADSGGNGTDSKDSDERPTLKRRDNTDNPPE